MKKQILILVKNSKNISNIKNRVAIRINSSVANQTGEKMQAGAADVTQQGKSIFNKRAEVLQ